MSFYLDPLECRSNSGIVLQQGDIVRSIPFIEVNPSKIRIIDPKTGLVSDSNADSIPGAGDIVSTYYIGNGIITTQTCDLARSKPITIAPIFPISVTRPDAKIESGTFKKLWAEWENPGKSPPIFPLPPCTKVDFACSTANLLTMQSYDLNSFHFIEKNTILRLSPAALGKFQERLAFLLGRFAAPSGLFSL